MENRDGQIERQTDTVREASIKTDRLANSQRKEDAGKRKKRREKRNIDKIDNI